MNSESLSDAAEEQRSEHRRGDHGPVRAERLGADRERCQNTIPAICMHTPHHKQHCAQRPIFLPVSLLLNCNKKSNSSSFSELQQVVDAIF